MTDERLPNEEEFGEEGEEEAQAPPSATTQETPKGLRDRLSRAEKENRSLREQVMTSHLEALGLRRDIGLGKAIFKEYSGDFSLEAIRTYAAEEYGHDSGTSPVEPPEVAIAEKVAGMNAVSTSVIPPPPTDEAAELVAKMHDPEATRDDAVNSLNAKLDQFGREQYPHAYPKQ